MTCRRQLAVFLCTMPLLTALSRRLVISRYWVSASVPGPVLTMSSSFRVPVRIRDLTILFRTLRFSLC